MYMTLEYDPRYSHGTPAELRMKIQTQDGPEHAVVTWGPWDKPVRVDDGTMRLTCDAKVNRTGGLAAFVMYGAAITSVVTDNGAEIMITSLRFSENTAHAGFSIDRLPRTFRSADPKNEKLPEYFCRKGLFVGEPKLCGGMHELAFDGDVSSERIESFLKQHPDGMLGAFCTAARLDKNNNPYWLQCYLYACQDHADVDLSVWKSKDRHDKEDF